MNKFDTIKYKNNYDRIRFTVKEEIIQEYTTLNNRLINRLLDQEIFNEETIEAFDEGDKMLENRNGRRYTNTKDLFADLEK